MRKSLHFLGAAGCVTGSRFLLEVDGEKVLFDAGLFQGRKELRKRNWERLPLAANRIGAVCLTHGHIDHIGYLPKLVEQGFSGPVHCTPATAALAELLLPDSAKIQEEQARHANEKGYSRHRPALPLYTQGDVDRALPLLRTHDYGEPFEIASGIGCTLRPSGHILGSAFAEVVAGGTRIVFSGDLGGYDDAIMKPPAPIPADTDFVLVESTYGGRTSDNRPIRDQMREELAPVLSNDGVVVIPAFAVGRTTLVLFHLRELMESGEIPEVPVFVDSPMATDATSLYCRFGSEHNLRVDLLEDAIRCPIRTSDIHFVKRVEDSKKLNHFKGPGIIVSASGMAVGGRVLHHLKRRLPHEQNLVLLVGYQAAGTRGRRMLEGEKTIKLLGEHVPVRARVASIRGLSAHGDSDEIMRWLATASGKPRKVFLVHGEEEGLKSMAARVEAELGFPHHTPEYLEKVEIG